MKFQVGDRVRCFRGPDKGKTGSVQNADSGDGLTRLNVDTEDADVGYLWWVDTKDLKLAGPKMRLVDKGGHFAMEPV